MAQAYLKAWGVRSLSDEDENAANHLYDWASSIALPSPVFAEVGDLDDLSDGRRVLSLKLNRMANRKQAERHLFETAD